jgi:hypothetical protein
MQLATRPKDSLTSSDDSTLRDKSPGDQHEYRFIRGARGITKDGMQASFEDYESTDGVMILTRTESFRTAAEMATQFKAKTKGLSEIIERTEVEDSQVNIKGVRIVGKHFGNDPGVTEYVIIFTGEIEISYIESVSLAHLLDFEEKVEKHHR